MKMAFTIKQIAEAPNRGCHAGGRGFESRPARHIKIPQLVDSAEFCFLAFTKISILDKIWTNYFTRLLFHIVFEWPVRPG